MLNRSLVVSRQLTRYPLTIIRRRPYSSTEINPRVMPHQELRLSPHKQKQPQRLPFAKNFFLGKYDTEFAAFPVPQTTARHGEFFQWLKPIEDYVRTIDIRAIDTSAEIPQDVLGDLRELGVFRAAVPDEYHGLGLNNSEYAKLVEVLSAIPVLGATFAKRRTAVEYLIEHSSDEQKSIFLPRIASGELNPTVCITEDDEGSSDTAIFSHAKISDCERYFIINGRKTYVANARTSNLFIVVCECTDTGKTFRPEETTSVFLVEKDAGGITISPPHKTMGLRGLDVCQVNFTDTKIPRENIVGEIGTASKSFVKMFGEGKQYLGSQAIGITRKYLELMVQYFKANPDFNSTKFKNQLVQEVIGKTCGAIFGMESVVYLTAGMMDNFADQDCDMEKCMVDVFCADECIQTLLYGLQITGGTGNSQDELFQQYFRDAVALMSVDGTLVNSKIFVGMLGLQYTGDIVSGKIKIHRTPWNHPTYVLQHIFKIEFTKSLYIDDNLHPSLQTTAKLLEYSIGRLKSSIENMAIQYGREVFDKPAAHKRVAEYASYLYAISAILARTSRSYCLGMRDAEKEVHLTQVYGYMLYERVQRLAEQLSDTEWVNGDKILRDISDRVFEKDGYFVEHPLARNFS